MRPTDLEQPFHLVIKIAAIYNRRCARIPNARFLDRWAAFRKLSSRCSSARSCSRSLDKVSRNTDRNVNIRARVNVARRCLRRAVESSELRLGQETVEDVAHLVEEGADEVRVTP